MLSKEAEERFTKFLADAFADYVATEFAYWCMFDNPTDAEKFKADLADDIEGLIEQSERDQIAKEILYAAPLEFAEFRNRVMKKFAERFFQSVADHFVKEWVEKEQLPSLLERELPRFFSTRDEYLAKRLKANV